MPNHFNIFEHGIHVGVFTYLQNERQTQAKAGKHVKVYFFCPKLFERLKPIYVSHMCVSYVNAKCVHILTFSTIHVHKHTRSQSEEISKYRNCYT